MDVRKTLFVLGALMIVLAALWPLLAKLPLFRLPGDVVIARDGVRVFIPIMTSVVLSIVLTVVFWLLRR